MLPFARKAAGEPRVGDLPARPIPVIPRRLSMGAARKIAALKQTALLLVESDELLVGSVDERALATAADDTGVADVMTPLGICLQPGTSVARARQLFIIARAPILPIVAGGFVIGAITRGQVEREIARFQEARRPAKRERAPAIERAPLDRRAIGSR
jgi:CBS domain-containing protein